MARTVRNIGGFLYGFAGTKLVIEAASKAPLSPLWLGLFMLATFMLLMALLIECIEMQQKED